MRRTLLFTLACLLGLVSAKAQVDEQAGPSVKWAYTEGTLTISGTGKMYNYNDSDNKAPWRDMDFDGNGRNDDIREVVIEAGVTHIGDYAFANMHGLNLLVIGKDVETIGNDAFSYSSLEEVTIHAERVIELGTDAFKTDRDNNLPIASFYVPQEVRADYKKHNIWGEFRIHSIYTEINGLDDLIGFRNEVNAGITHKGREIELTADIDFKDDESESELDWEPIGTSDKPFKGTFNGNGHTISNLKISDENKSNYRGLFGNIDKAVINDLILEDVLIESSSFSGIVFTGALAASSNNSTIENCHVLSGTIKESIATGGELAETNTGGLIGYFFFEEEGEGEEGEEEGGVKLCSNNARVISNVNSPISRIGGLIGILDQGLVDRCFNQGEITAKGATGFQGIGGLVGVANSYSNILNSYNVGNIMVETDTRVYAGGIAGYTTDMMIAFCYSYADITGGTSTASSTGGIVGFLDNAGIGFSLSLSEKLTGGEGEIGFVCGTLFGESTITEVYSWVKGMNADLYYDGENTHQKNGALWDGLMNSEPLVYSGDYSEFDWSADNWNIDATDALMPKLKDLLEGIVQPDVKNPLKASDTPSGIYHTITLEVAGDINLYDMTAGALQIEEGGHLHLQFMPEATTATAEDILFLVDGVETEFTSFGAGTYYSYILNPISGDHTILIAMKEYTVTLPELEGVKINVGTGVHTVPYGEKFTFTLTLDDSIDPADVHVFANGIEVKPDALRATVLSYTIDKVITSIEVVIEGANTTGNTDIAGGKISVAIDNGQLTMDNGTANAVDVAVYSITGQNVVSLRGLCGSKTVTLKPGVYIVRAGNQSWKVMVNY